MAVRTMTSCAGFLLAVLWMDLIFDTQIGRRARREESDAVALASIAGYYRRATTTSRPMSVLIVLVMSILLGALAIEAAHEQRPAWLIAVSAVLAGGPILLALVRTVPNAVRLGSQTDPTAGQSRLARAILLDHIVCFGGISAFLVLWLVAG